MHQTVKPIVFGSFMSPNLAETYTQVAMAVGQAVGRPATFAQGLGLDDLREGRVDVAFLCGLPYVRLQAERPGTITPLVAPVLLDERYGGRPRYYSDVIVRQESRFHRLLDLRGSSWSHTDPDSFSGCVLTRYQLALMAESEAFFGKVSFAGSHESAIRRVLEGEVDAAAIDSHVLGVEQRQREQLSQQLRIIASFGPSPIPPVVATGRLPAELRSLIHEAFVGLAADGHIRSILRNGLIERFASVSDRDYDDIRQKAAVAERLRAAV